MAFVFRSEKQSIFQNSKSIKLKTYSQLEIAEEALKAEAALNNKVNDKQFRSANLGTKKIFKGLPSLLSRKNISEEERQTLKKIEKQNIFGQNKNQSMPNLNKVAQLQKKQQKTENYFFTSKTNRLPFGKPFKQLIDNYNDIEFIQKQTTQNKNYQNSNNKKSSNDLFTPNRLMKNENKNLLTTASQLKHEFKKQSIQNCKNYGQQQTNLLISYSRQPTTQLKRKSSPPKNIETNLRNMPSIIKNQKKEINSFQIQSYKNKINQTSQNKIIQKQSEQINKNYQNDQLNNSQNNKSFNRYLNSTDNSNNNSFQNQQKQNIKITQQNTTLKKQIKTKSSILKKGHLNSSFYRQQVDQDQDQQDQQLDQIPGPGSYENNFNIKAKKNFRSNKQKFAKIFVSPLQRFKTQNIKYHQVTYVNENNNNKDRKFHKQNSFLSKSPKFQVQKTKSISPPPGFYHIRQSIQHDIVKNLLKSANTIFCSSVPRFNYKQPEQIPGPGHYDINILQKLKLQEQKNQLSFSYKSEVKRNINGNKNDIIDSFDKIKQSNPILKQTIKVSILEDQDNMNYQLIHKCIHSKQQNFQASQFFTAPPFLSGVERFIKPSSDHQNNQNNKKYSCKYQNKPSSAFLTFNDIISKEKVVPFNSSSKRPFSQIIGQGIGVGSYGIDYNKWTKKSYNVLFD